MAARPLGGTPEPAAGGGELTVPAVPADPSRRTERHPADPDRSRTAPAGRPRPDSPATPEEARTIASWDRDLTALTGELRRNRQSVREVPLPTSLTASQVLRLAADEAGFARELARPMPRPPAPAARRGTEFHAWVESRFQPLPLLEPDELPGFEDEGIADERELAELKEAFLRTPYAERTPHRVEAPFQLLLGDRLIRGRIDAVYRVRPGADADSGHDYDYEVVDWKTHRAPTADPLQLAVYRLAWAEQAGLDPERVSAAFVYIRTGEIVRPESLPGRPELTALLTGEEPDPQPEAQTDPRPDPHPDS